MRLAAHAEFQRLNGVLDAVLLDAPEARLRPRISAGAGTGAPAPAAGGLRRRRPDEAAGRADDNDDDDVNANVEAEAEECSICMEPMFDAKTCPQCRQLCHRHCLKSWLRGKPPGEWSCPSCRHLFAPAPAQPQPPAPLQRAPPPPAVPAAPDQPPRRAAVGGLAGAIQQLAAAFHPVQHVDAQALAALREMLPHIEPRALADFARQHGVNAAVDAAMAGLLPAAEQALPAPPVQNAEEGEVDGEEEGEEERGEEEGEEEGEEDDEEEEEEEGEGQEEYFEEEGRGIGFAEGAASNLPMLPSMPVFDLRPLPAAPPQSPEERRLLRLAAVEARLR